MACEPISAAGDGKVGILGGRVDDVSKKQATPLVPLIQHGPGPGMSNIPCKPVDILCMLIQPSPVKLADYRSYG